MAKRRGPRDYTLPGNPADPQGFYVLGLHYLEWLRIKHYTEASVHNVWRALNRFIQWCGPRGLDRPNQITPPILERYARHLYYARRPDGEPVGIFTQRAALNPLVIYFRWLAKQRHILYNPAADLERPKQRHRLPRHVLTAEEAQHVLNLPNITDPIGIRDRAMLETLYSTGMRRMELANLKIGDIDLHRGTVLILQGKGRKDRFIPIGERACLWITRYLEQVRPEFVTYDDDGTLFLTALGEPFSPCWLSTTVGEYIKRANLNKTGGCHLFRHTLATVMLENGADIRHIQVILGHTDLRTTQIYTHLNIRQIKAIHNATHPTAKLKPKQNDNDDESGEVKTTDTTASDPSLAAVLNKGSEEKANDADDDRATADTVQRRKHTR